MSRPRPRRAVRPSLAVRAARITVPALAITALGVGVAGAVMPGDSPQVAYPASATSASPESSALETTARRQELSRRNTRPPATAAPKPQTVVSETITPIRPPKLKVIDSKYATTELNVRSEPKEDASAVASVDAGTKVSVTATVTNGFRYISYHEKGRWVKNQYLSDKKPTSTVGSGGISGAPCPSGSSVESGLTPDAIRVHRALCHRYPQISAFYGRRSSSGYHGEGRALDNMISDSTVGWEIAKWVPINDFSRTKIDATVTELREEKELVKELLG